MASSRVLPGAEARAGERAAPPVARRGERLRRWLLRARVRMRRHPALYLSYRIFLAVVGTAIIIGGLILVPLPGPGWLIVFIGLAVLGIEFRWARRLGRWVRAQLARFWQWWRARRDRARR
jgi:uncharacterized protein (TIGR02611 family)